MEEFFSDLPDDNNLAFIKLHSDFKKEFEFNLQGSDSNFRYHAANYMNNTLAAASALDVVELGNFGVTPSNAKRFDDDFAHFSIAVENIVIQIKIKYSRRNTAMSVGLTVEQKSKIHILIDKIREEIECSSAVTAKKEKLYKIISALALEVDKSRTGLERFGDLARGLSSVSKELADGAEPWWKWFKLIMGEVDEAKESEPALPKPEERKKLEAPRKQLPKPDTNDLDDEIPF